MAYFPDMTVCTYFDRGPTSEWLCRLLAIGWLEKGHEFTQGPVEERVVGALRRLYGQFCGRFPSITTLGLHACSLCPPAEFRLRAITGSNINLFIPARGFVYVAPGRVDHHIEVHGYAPPEAFIEAVLDCPDPTSEEYRNRMADANRGQDAPIFRGQSDPRGDRPGS